MILDQNSEKEVKIDEQKIRNIPVNSTDPLFLAAEVFRETLLEVGVSAETAD